MVTAFDGLLGSASRPVRVWLARAALAAHLALLAAILPGPATVSCRAADAVEAMSLLPACAGGASLTIPELAAQCALPGRCGERLACEGMVALVEGWIDFENVFDRQHHPALPYEKFTVRDADGQAALEVWAPRGGDNRRFFERLWESRERSGGRVRIRGVLVGIDLPTMGRCDRWVRLDIDGEPSLAPIVGSAGEGQ